MSKDKSDKNWFARHKILTAIGIVAIFAIIAGATGGSDSSSPTTKNSADKTASNEQKTEFAKGEVISFDKRDLTVTKVQRDYQTGNQFAQPESGNEFVIVTVTLKNNSDASMTYNTFDFKLQDSDGVQKDEDIMALSEGKLNSGSLAPGGTVTGKIGYQVSKGDSGLKLIYNGSLFGKTITVNL